MNKKVLLVVIICVVFGIVVLFNFGFSEQTTEINNQYVNGTIQGVVIENTSDEFSSYPMINYHDEDNGIYYEILMADSLDFTKGGIINLAGAEKISKKEYNGVEWEIYYLKSGNFDLKYNINPVFSSFQSGYFCFASGKNGDYFITVSSGSVNSNNSMDSDLIKNYVEPLLNNITLKNPKNPPKEYQILNSTKEEYDTFLGYTNQNGWESIKNNMMY